MKKKLLIIFFFFLAFIFTLCFSDQEEVTLLMKGDDIIKRINDFKSKKGYLPLSLEDIGVKDTEEGPIFYELLDSLNYSVHFGTSLGESKIYYSDSQKWEDRLR